MVEFILFIVALTVIIVTGFLLFRLRSVVADERRMNGFYPMSVMALVWITASTIDLLSAPDFFAYTYVTKVAFSIIVPYSKPPATLIAWRQISWINP